MRLKFKLICAVWFANF